MRRGTKTLVAKELCGHSRKAGTWSLPKMSDAVSLIKFVKRMKNGEWPIPIDKDVSSTLYPILGDDDLFDHLDYAKKIYLQTCAEHVAAKVKAMAKQGYDNPDSFNNPEDVKVLQWIANRI